MWKMWKLCILAAALQSLGPKFQSYYAVCQRLHLTHSTHAQATFPYVPTSPTNPWSGARQRMPMKLRSVLTVPLKGIVH
jgi:hypothetical protein